MKAVIAEQYGGVEVLEISDDLPVPRVGPNGVLVEVRAASVNPVDWKLRQGLLHAVMPVVFPVIWGCDLSGVVKEVGPAVTLFKPGDEVYGMKDGYVAKTYRGTYAEYVVVPEKSLAAKPKNLSHEEAAAVPLAALTAWQAMVNQGRLKPGQRVLIHAGAGGVGVMAIQIAKAFGAYVAATASTRNQDLLRELGADLAIDYTREKISKVRPKFDLVLDGVGEKRVGRVISRTESGRSTGYSRLRPFRKSQAASLSFLRRRSAGNGIRRCARIAGRQTIVDDAGEATRR